MTETLLPTALRISEARLLELETWASDDLKLKLKSDLSITPQDVVDLVAEIGRYRALLIGLAAGALQACPTCRGPRILGVPVAAVVSAVYVDGEPRGPVRFIHTRDCPWSALEAEVQAILAERAIAASPAP